MIKRKHDAGHLHTVFKIKWKQEATHGINGTAGAFLYLFNGFFRDIHTEYVIPSGNVMIPSKGQRKAA